MEWSVSWLSSPHCNINILNDHAHYQSHSISIVMPYYPCITCCSFSTLLDICWFLQGGSKHGRYTFGISYEDYYAREISRFVCNICWIDLNCLQYLFAIINKISGSSPSVVVAQWVRRWRGNHRMVQAEGSSPRGDVYQISFQQWFYFSFMLGLMDFSDIAILCSRPKVVANKTLSVLINLYHLFSSGLFLWKSSHDC